MAKFQDFRDSFNDNSIGAVWGSYGTTTTVAETGGSLVFNTSTSAGYGGLDSIATYDLTSSFALMQLLSAGNQSLASMEVVPVQVTKDTNNALFWYVNGGSLIAYKKVASSVTIVSSTTYSAAVHQWFRIREASGTTYYEYSTDGVGWTVFTSLANPFALTALTVDPSVGTYATEASGTTVIMDNFNCPPIGALHRHLVVGNGMSRAEVLN